MCLTFDLKILETTEGDSGFLEFIKQLQIALDKPQRQSGGGGGEAASLDERTTGDLECFGHGGNSTHAQFVGQGEARPTCSTLPQ